ncbi:glycosyltransferase, partial [Lactobacillus gallinarum]|nr:glycosyltransferase [Lactobacillus gallinarum]
MQLSYIIPAYNCENTIRETIKSIIKNSSNVSYEIIIIENG